MAVLSKRQDSYIQDPQKLNGQPKRVIGQYVHDNGFRTPVIFESFAEAKKAALKGTIVRARSECIKEYNGFSGFFSSPLFSSISNIALLNEQDFKSNILGKPYTKEAIRSFCAYSGEKPSSFVNGVSFSYWQNLEGANRTIVADSSIENRFHIMTTLLSKHELGGLYTVVDNGKIIEYSPLPVELRKTLFGLVDLYQSIRELDNFDPHHCPIMEFETVGKRHYFLQYHRVRDFEQSSFVLDDAQYNGTTEAAFVRGVTPATGLVCQVSVFPASMAFPASLPNTESAIEPSGSSRALYPEIMSRRRIIQIINSNHWAPFEVLEDVASKHTSRSKLFKPVVSFITPQFRRLTTEDEDAESMDRILDGKPPLSINVFVCSDGRRAFYRRLD